MSTAHLPNGAPRAARSNALRVVDDGPPMVAREREYLAGDVVAGKYLLRGALGEGGMGAVWLAKNLALDIDVALKLIRREVATPQASARLLQEARAAARLDHPSIVRVFDFGETERGDPFIVMEVLHGQSMGDRLAQRGRVPAVEAIQMLLPVANALTVAHRCGVVHRDLKPDNIFLASDAGGNVVPKLVDFGIAKLRRDDASRNLTLAGTVLGSPDYMSPEQSRGQSDIDERSDIYTFCVLVYEAVTGRRPFEGHNYNALLSSIINDPPTPITAFAAGDAPLWSILERGMAKAREERFATMLELADALSLWVLAGASRSRRLPRPPRRPGTRAHRLPATSRRSTTPTQSHG